MSSPQREDAGKGEDWGPRENDHLVEPFFSGLGAKGDTEAEKETESSSPRSDATRPGLLGRLIAFFRRG